MPSTCTICALPPARVKKINDIYIAGHPIDEISLAYSLDMGALTAHFSTCSLVPVEKAKKEQDLGKDKVEFSAKDKYSKLVKEIEEVLAQSYQNLCNANGNVDGMDTGDESGFKFDNTPKLQTAYAKLVDTYTKVLKDIENQRNEEVVVKGLIETIITPLMQSTLKITIEEIDRLKSEMIKQGILSPELQKMLVETFKSIGNKTKDEMSASIDKLYKYFDIENKE